MRLIKTAYKEFDKIKQHFLLIAGTTVLQTNANSTATAIILCMSFQVLGKSTRKITGIMSSSGIWAKMGCCSMFFVPFLIILMAPALSSADENRVSEHSMGFFYSSYDNTYPNLPYMHEDDNYSSERIVDLFDFAKAIVLTIRKESFFKTPSWTPNWVNDNLQHFSFNMDASGNIFLIFKLEF